MVTQSFVEVQKNKKKKDFLHICFIAHKYLNFKNIRTSEKNLIASTMNILPLYNTNNVLNYWASCI